MSDCTSVLPPAPVGAEAEVDDEAADEADDGKVVAEVDVAPVTVTVSVFVAPESEEWPQAAAVSPTTTAAAPARQVL